MPQTCSICAHPERLQIEASLIAGMSLSNVAQRFSVSRDAVYRHKHNCIQPAIQSVQTEQKAIQKEQTEQTAWNAITQMQTLHDEAWTIYRETRITRDHRFSLQSLAEIRKQTELFAELLSNSEQSTQEQLQQEWVNLREIIFTALEPFPDARLAVARALLTLETHDDSNTTTHAS